MQDLTSDYTILDKQRPRKNGSANRLDISDRAIHDWYRFVLSFPPHLVREYLQRFNLDRNSLLLDPFCGTGTTLVEAKKLGIPSIGIEFNPMAHFASEVKTTWEIDTKGLIKHSAKTFKFAQQKLVGMRISDTPSESNQHISLTRLRRLPEGLDALLLRNSMSPLPYHKALELFDSILSNYRHGYSEIELLALANVVVYTSSNLKFGPEVGIGQIRSDSQVLRPWRDQVIRIAYDIERFANKAVTKSQVLNQDSRVAVRRLERSTISAIITSPPYPNEKDYTRTTRLESVLLGFVRSKDDLRELKKGLVRSNTRGVYKNDDDEKWVSDFSEIQRIAQAIEDRRVALGKTSGFERMYPRVVKLYFGGMYRHLMELRDSLKPGARLAYVVGDQASYLQVMIRTGQILATIAEELGYEVESIDLFRTRLATATKEQLREEVLVLRWPERNIK